jgi:hypothetical protein
LVEWKGYRDAFAEDYWGGVYDGRAEGEEVGEVAGFDEGAYWVFARYVEGQIGGRTAGPGVMKVKRVRVEFVSIISVFF